MLDALRLLNLSIANPMARFLLKRLSSSCEEDAKSVLETALELWTGTRSNACVRCKLAAKLLRSFIFVGGLVFGIKEGELRKTFENGYWRKSLLCVIKGLAHLGVRKPFVSGAPFLVVWDITHACNLRCKHCYANSPHSSQEVSTEEAKLIIDKLHSAGVPILAFSGGEPLLREDILELCGYASDDEMYVAIATNGTLLTERTCEELKAAGVGFLQISLDAATPELHDSFRGVRGSFERAVRGIRNAVEAGFFVCVAFTATKRSWKELPKLLDLCEGLGVDWLMVYNFIPTGRGRELVAEDLSPVEREELLKTLLNALEQRKITTLTTAPQFARVALQHGCGGRVPTHFSVPKFQGKPIELASFIGGCGCGRFYLALKPNGDVQPCVFLPLRLGNLLEQELDEIWLKNEVLAELRDKEGLENCRSCEYRYYCGGCRARAYNYFGNHLAPDPGCVRNKELFLSLQG